VYFEQGDGTCAAYADCAAPLVLCTIEGGGHSWPGGVPKTGVVECPADGIQSSSFFASEVAWKFFQENPLPAH
jgi:polyhydroxybutyrate depolymerase